MLHISALMRPKCTSPKKGEIGKRTSKAKADISILRRAQPTMAGSKPEELGTTSQTQNRPKPAENIPGANTHSWTT